MNTFFNSLVKKEKKLAIIDSNSLLTTAYYAVAPLHAPDGTPTNGVKGFLNVLGTILADDPTHVVAVFDGRESFDVLNTTIRLPSTDSGTRRLRKDIYPAYKDGRPPMPDDLERQYPIVIELLYRMGIPCVWQHQTEGDDIIAEIAYLANNGYGGNEKMPVTVYTYDKDMLALCVYENVKIHIMKHHIDYDINNVNEVFNVDAEQITLYKALCGDPSDNIPGVYGVGKVAATTILSVCPTYSEIIEESRGSTHRLPDRLHNKLHNSADLFVLSYVLASFFPVSVPPNTSWERGEVDYKKYKGFINKYAINDVDIVLNDD